MVPSKETFFEKLSRFFVCGSPYSCAEFIFDIPFPFPYLYIMSIYAGKRGEIGLGWHLPAPANLVERAKRILPGGNMPDLDLVALLLDTDGKLVRLGHSIQKNGKVLPLIDSDVIYFHNLRGPGNAIHHSGDARKGAYEQEDESITLFFEGIPPVYKRIRCMVLLWNKLSQNAGDVSFEAAWTFRDAEGKQVIHQKIQDDTLRKGGMIFMDFVRGSHAKWTYEIMNTPIVGETLADFIRPYVR